MTQESVNWTTENKKVKAIQINNKEVQSIEANNIVIWQKESEIDYDNIMELKITGNKFSINSSTPFVYTGRVFVDWGDDSGIVEYIGGKLTHTYSSSDDYTVKIYGNITSLKTGCFYNCRSLTSIEIPNSVTSLENNCFYNCAGLTSINIPNSVTSIGNDCFYGCTGLTSINIPSSVTSLGEYCFVRCSNLTSIILNWSTNDEIRTYNQYWITDTPSNLIFYIPSDTKSAYINKGYPSDKLVETTVNEKIDTQFIENKMELWLQDINGNDLEGKLITYQACDNNTLTTFTKNSGVGGGTFLSPTNIKCVVFAGDEEYNGCSYENSNFKGCGGSIPNPK
jgi:hypothetical protein